MLPKKYQHITRQLAVKKSKAGLGLFTQAPIEKGGFIIEYVGEAITTAEADKRGGKYLFETSKNRTIDGSARSNTARYINHSCSPNCEVEVRRGHILIFAKRDIEAGEELNYDYGKEYFDEYIRPIGCRCSKCQ
jgi:SET domain-containing protein